MTVREKNNAKKKRWWGCGFSCFGDPNVYDMDGTKKEFIRKPVRKKALSRVIRKKKTVPIEIAGNAMECEVKGRNSDGKTESNCEGQSKPEKCLDQIKKQKHSKPDSPRKSTSDAATLPVQNMTLKSEYISKSGPLCKTLDLVSNQTQLRTSNCNSPATSRYSTPEDSLWRMNPDGGKIGKTDPSKIIPVIAVAAILVLLLGRVLAIFSMCVYFYAVARFNSDAENKDIKMGNKYIDLNSKVHQQTVVLQGFLGRGKNRLVSSFSS